MAIVTRAEFAALCGDDVKFLNTYIARNKVVLLDKKTLDTNNPLNKAFIKERQLKNAAKKENIALIRAIPNVNYNERQTEDDPLEENSGTPRPISKKAAAEAMSSQLAFKTGQLGRADYMFMQLKGTAEWAVTKAEREKLLLEKAQGQLLPVDLVMDINLRYGTVIFSSLTSAIEVIANKYCQIMAGGDMTMYTRIMEEARFELERFIGKAENEMNEDIERLINTFSEARGRGERKAS